MYTDRPNRARTRYRFTDLNDLFDAVTPRCIGAAERYRGSVRKRSGDKRAPVND
jgi:hypothetical protein